MIIDSHIHVFADALAPRALASLSKTAGVPAYTDLTEASTRAHLASHGIDFGVVMPIATKPTQQKTINDWACSIQNGNLVSFGTVYPTDPTALEEVSRIAEMGLHGIKLHPDYQNYCADEESAYPVYSKIAEVGLPVIFHAGWDPVSPEKAHCTPEMLRRVQDTFPDLKVIGAHMGGNQDYDASERYLIGTQLYIDISLMPIYGTYEQFERMVLAHPADRILFATDTPWSDPSQTITWVQRLPVSEERKEQIFWKNAAALLNISVDLQDTLGSDANTGTNSSDAALPS